MNYVPPSVDTTHHVASWITRLAQITRQPEPIKKEALANYVSLLASEFPGAAFTMQSLNAIAEECEFFPAYAVLRKKIAEWWDNHKPAQKAITDDRRADWSEMDHHWLNYWHKRQAEGFAPMPDRPGSGGRDHVASLISTYSPKAWRYISGGNA